jgi:hypothetical protein
MEETNLELQISLDMHIRNLHKEVVDTYKDLPEELVLGRGTKVDIETTRTLSETTRCEFQTYVSCLTFKF